MNAIAFITRLRLALMARTAPPLPSQGVRRVWLDAGSVQTLRGTPGKTILCCQHGVVWITQPGDSHDIVLVTGQRHAVACRELIVVQGLTDALVCVVPS